MGTAGAIGLGMMVGEGLAGGWECAGGGSIVIGCGAIEIAAAGAETET